MSEESRDLERMLGDPKGAIRSMLLPLIVSYMVVQINLFADTSWCSGLGADASSAVSTISPFYWIVSGLGTGLGIGAATAIARYLGRGEKHNADRLASQTVVLSVILGVATTPILLLMVDPAISMMGAQDIAAECREYILPQIIAGTVVIMDGTVSGVIRSEGAAKRSMVMLLVAAAVNMVLDPVMIYGLDLGLTGAGWATAIASASSAALGLWWYHRGRLYLTMSLKDMRPNWTDMREILYVGIPRGTESMLISVMSMVQRIFVIACGGTSAAMFYNIPWRFVSISEVVSQAVGSALIPVCSAALGRKDFAKAETGFRYSLTLTMVVMTAIAAVLFVFADWVIIPFTYYLHAIVVRTQHTDCRHAVLRQLGVAGRDLLEPVHGGGRRRTADALAGQGGLQALQARTREARVHVKSKYPQEDVASWNTTHRSTSRKTRRSTLHPMTASS